MWFAVTTNYRTFTLEAAGIGDAIATALDLLVNGEYLSAAIVPTATPKLAA